MAEPEYTQHLRAVLRTHRQFNIQHDKALSEIEENRQREIHHAIIAGEECKLDIQGMAERITFSPDNRLFAAWVRDSLFIWNTKDYSVYQRFDGYGPMMGFSHDGMLFAAGHHKRRREIQVWDMTSGKAIRQLKTTKDVYDLAFLPDGERLVVATGGSLEIWKIRGLLGARRIYAIEMPVGVIDRLAVSPDGQMIAISGVKLVWEGKELCESFKTLLIDVKSSRIIHTLEMMERSLSWSEPLFREHSLSLSKPLFKFRPTFSPDGKFLAVTYSRSHADEDKERVVTVWRVKDGKKVCELRRFRAGYSSVHPLVSKFLGGEFISNGLAFSPDERLLASTTLNGVILWEVSSWKEKCTLVAPDEDVAFSPNGRLLAAGGCKIVIWRIATEEELKQRIAQINQQAEHAVSEAGKVFDDAFKQQVLQELQAHYKYLPDPGVTIVAPWDNNQVWSSWKPVSGLVSPIMVRIGRLTDRQKYSRIHFPACASLINQYNVLFKLSGSAHTTAVQAVQSMLIRLIATAPPGKLRFTFIDPVGLGQNVAPFMALADYDEQLVTARAWSDPRHIEQRLAELTEHIETVIQKYMRHEYATIEEYNEKAGEIAEPYRILVVFDFPANFTEETAHRLVSIVQNGPRCGVYAVILIDHDRPLPHGFNLAELERACTVIAWKDGRWVWEDEDFRECTLELDGPPPAELLNRIIQKVGERAKEASRVEVPFERIAPPAVQWWTASSAEGIRVPLGPAGARKVQELALGKGTSQHALVAGKTGSGKSTLLHVLITNLALHYSPDEVQVYLVDFKKGVEFKPYATYNLPHARVVAIESEREFGLSVLQGLDTELKRRGDLFRAAGVDHIADYRARTGQPMSRILLIVDEFQEFFTEDDPIASQAAQVLDRLVRQGRAFGIHVLLGSQTLAGSYTLARSTIDQMAVRIALQCSEADSRLILADDNPAARRLSRPGEAIYNDANGLVEGNHPFQVAWLADEQREKYLQKIAALATERQYRPPQPQIIFEGNAPAQVEKNRILGDLLAAPTWPSKQRRVHAWLGEPIAIADPTAAYFRRQSGSNLLIVGQNDEGALGMMAVALISLAAQHAPQDIVFYVLDFGAVDAPYAGLWDTLASVLPHTVKIGRRRQLPDIIGELAAEVQRRLDSEQAGTPSRYLFLYGLQRARDLRQEEMGFGGFGSSLGEEPVAPSPAQQLSTILREGPDLGVHTIVWCDTVTNLNRSLERRALREFAMRAVFQMSAEDSANLIDSPAASKLGPYRTLFYDEEEGRLEKFRPYGLPSDEWLARVKGWLIGRL